MRFITSLCLSVAVAICVSYAMADGGSLATIPATAPTTTASTITWDQAKDHIGESVTVTGPVIGTHTAGKGASLNVGKDFPDPDRFTVYIPADKQKELPDDLDKGKTISVTGKLKLFHNVPEIEADAAHITVVDASPTTAASQP